MTARPDDTAISPYRKALVDEFRDRLLRKGISVKDRRAIAERHGIRAGRTGDSDSVTAALVAGMESSDEIARDVIRFLVGRLVYRDTVAGVRIDP